MPRKFSVICFIAVFAVMASLLSGAAYAQSAVEGIKGATYVGAAKCRECHEKIYEGWRTTFHPYKFQDVSPDTVVADFTNNNTLEAGGYTSKMYRKGDEFFITTMVIIWLFTIMFFR